MKHEWIKAMVGKLAATGTILLFLVLVPAAADEKEMPPTTP